MTLHVAIKKLLGEVGRPMTTQEIANNLNQNKWYQKLDGSAITAFQIHGRTKNYPQIFKRNGTTVSLAGQKTPKIFEGEIANNKKKKSCEILTKDEDYVLDLCDTILNFASSRQHRFDFLVGDTNTNGLRVRLPVDAYWQKFNLVVEYRERQHTEAVTFFDKPNRITVSGVHRGEQRKIYDERRRDLIPKNGLILVEISYSDFNYDTKKRIIRVREKDEEIVRNILRRYVGEPK